MRRVWSGRWARESGRKASPIFNKPATCRQGRLYHRMTVAATLAASPHVALRLGPSGSDDRLLPRFPSSPSIGDLLKILQTDTRSGGIAVLWSYSIFGLSTNFPL